MQPQQAFNVYRAPKVGENRSALLSEFTAKYVARDVKIAMVGVWDTVGALGIPGDLFIGLNTNHYGFLDTSLHPDVQTAYHTMAIEERRREFLPTLWTPPYSATQTVEQVWFAGVHSDVGGGYSEHGLSDITLGWMMGKARSNGLVFDPKLAPLYPPLANPPALSDPKLALDVLHESWTALWGFPSPRVIAPDASLSNSVAVRLSHTTGYQPQNLPPGFPSADGPFNIVPIVSDPT